MSTIDADSQAGPSTQRLVRPRKLTRCQKCKNFMYNKEEKTCMRRTGRQCLFLLMFYLLFHAISVAVFALFFYGISIETLGLDAKPLRRIRHSTSPCPTIVPTLFSAEGEVGIHYFKNDYKPYVKRITKFFRGD